MLLACAFLSGIRQSVVHFADSALLATVTDDSTEGPAFSVHTFGGFAGFAIVPMVVGSGGLAMGWEVALVAIGVVGIGSAIVVHLTIHAISTKASGTRELVQDATATPSDHYARRSARCWHSIYKQTSCSFVYLTC